MRLFRTLLLTAAISLIVSSFARADDKQEIRDLYAKLRDAILSPLPQGERALATKDFHARGLDGKAADVQQLVRQMKLPERDVTEARMMLLIYKFTITPPTAIVPYRYYYSSIVMDRNGKMGPKGKKHALSTTGLIRCDLIKTPGGWKLKSMESLTGITRIDRKIAGGPRKAPQ